MNEGGSAKVKRARRPMAPVQAEALAQAALDPAIVDRISAAHVKAASSPAVESDDPLPAAPAAEHFEGSISMATLSSPTEAADKAQAMFGDVQGRMKAAFDRSSRLGEEMLDFARGNVEAMMASARVATKASEMLGTEAADYSRKSVESATAAFKSFASVKSPTELFQLQSDYAKASFDSAVAEASKLSETMMKLAGEIAQPLSNRYALAAEKIRTTVA